MIKFGKESNICTLRPMSRCILDARPDSARRSLSISLIAHLLLASRWANVHPSMKPSCYKWCDISMGLNYVFVMLVPIGT